MLKKFLLVRYEATPEGTFGRFVMPSGEVLHSIELPWRDNRLRISCIPPGIYRADPVMSPSFKKVLYRLDDAQTAPRSAILIHAGNWAGDVEAGWHSNFLGCIGLGIGRSHLTPNGKQRQQAITGSGNAMQKFEAEANGERIQLDIIDYTGQNDPELNKAGF